MLPGSLIRAAGNFSQEETDAFAKASRVYRDPRSDRAVSLDGYREFLNEFGSGPRAAEAYFSIGELQLDAAIENRDSNLIFMKDPFLAPDFMGKVSWFSDARASYRKSLQKTDIPAFKDTIHYRLGEVAYNQKNWDDAVLSFNSVISASIPTYVKPQSLIALAATYVAKEDYLKSGKAIAQLRSEYPQYAGDPHALFVEGLGAFHEGRYADAERALKNLELPQAQYYLGKTYLQWDKPLLAAGVFKRLSAGELPANMRELTWFYLGHSFFVSKNYAASIETYNSFLKNFPASKLGSTALFRVGCSYFKNGDYVRARQVFETLIAKDRKDDYATLAQYLIAEALLASGNYKEALNAYTAVDGSKEFRALSLYKCIWVQIAMNENGDASATARKFIRQYPTSPLVPNAYLLLGNTSVKLKDYPNALSSYQRIMDVAPKSVIAEQALYLMLKLQYDLKNYGFILTSYQYLLKGASDKGSKWTSLSSLIVADIYLRTGRASEARLLYEAVLASGVGGVAALSAQDGLAWCSETMGENKNAIIARRKLKSMIQSGSPDSPLANLNDFGMAESFYGQKDYAAAHEFYMKFATEHSDLPQAGAALYRAGECLFQQKLYMQAVQVWQKLVDKMQSAPEATKAAFNIADTLFRAEKYKEARTAYDRILAGEAFATDPQAPFVLLRLAYCSYHLKEDVVALRSAEKLITGYPQSEEIGGALDLVEKIFEKYPTEKFKIFLRRVIEKNPTGQGASQTLFRLASGLYDRKNYAEAAQEFERFGTEHVSDPLLPKAQFYLGQSYFLLKDYQHAVSVFERYVGNYPGTPEIPMALFQLGSAYYGLKQYPNVDAPLLKLINGFPDSTYVALARFNMALAYQDSGQFDRANAAYELYIKAGVKPEQALAALWSIYENQQKTGAGADSIATLRRIIASVKKGDEVALEATYRIGEQQMTLGDEAEARRTWESLMRMKPLGSPYRIQAIIQLVKLYEAKQELKKAYSAYEDLSKNTDKKSVAKAARERMQEISSLRSGGKEK